MSNSILAIIVYILGLIFAALILDLWSAETGLKAFTKIIWPTILLIALFYTDKNDPKKYEN